MSAPTKSIRCFSLFVLGLVCLSGCEDRDRSVVIPASVAQKSAPAPKKVAATAESDESQGAEEFAPQVVHLGGDTPERLNRRDLEASIRRVLDRVGKCGSEIRERAVVEVRMVIGTGGGLKSTSVLEPWQGSELAQCVVHALQGTSFPRFTGSATVQQIEWTYPFVIEPR